MTLPGVAPLAEAAGAAFFDPFALHARLDFDIADRSGFAHNFPLLLHEYTHYLQSVSTVYGTYRVLDWIRVGVRLASVLPALAAIRVPLFDWQTRADCPQALRDQMAQIDMRLQLNAILEQPEPLDASAISAVGRLPIAQVPFGDDEPLAVVAVPFGELAIPIGARALAEGMAASIQRRWEPKPRVDALLAGLEPEQAGWYTATRTLLEQLAGPEVDLDVLNALVCDAALMTRNPPTAFMAAASAVAEAPEGASTDELIAASRETLREIIDEEVEATRGDLAGTLSRLAASDEPFAQAVVRLLTTCDELLARRAAAAPLAFPLDVLCGDAAGELLPLLRRYPLPCYFRHSTLLSWHGDDVLERLGEHLLMIEHVLRILLYGPESGRACPLAASSSCHAVKTALCHTAPWQIAVDADEMICAFGRAMATFGAMGKVTPTAR